MKIRTPLLSTLGLILVASLSACGGDDDDDSAGAGPGGQGPGGSTPGGPTGALGVLNEGLSGKLYYDAPAVYAELDIETGLVRSIRDGSEGARPSVDATEFAQSTSDPLGGGYDTNEVQIFGRDGRTLVRFELSEWVGGTVRLSPDGRRLAVEWHSIDEGDAGGVPIVNVFERDGTLLARYPEFGWYEWLPDGRLLVAGGETIAIVSQDLGEPQAVRSFPGDAPTDLSPSPDGRQIAFGLGERGVLENHVYVMNIDGSGLRQLTTSTLNEDGPAWSPDGRLIAVRQGIAYAALAGGVPGAGCPELWIVPADAESATLSEGAAGPARKLRSLDDDGSPRENACAFTPPAWRATPPDPPAVLGTASSGGGQNAGLTGRLFYSQPSNFAHLDLESGVATVVPGEGYGPWPSFDGREMAYQAEDPDSGSYDTEQINVATLDGTIVASFEQLESFSGPPKLSPDGQLIAVEWHAIDAGDAGGVPVVTVFRRDGSIVGRAEGFSSWAWAPNGELVLAAKNELYRSDAALTAPRLVTTLSDPISTLDVSPDGQLYAFAMAGHVWLMNADGEGLRQLTASGTTEGSPAFSPDGRYVAVQIDDTCPVGYVVPVDGERVFIGNPAVASSGRQLVMLERGATRNVCVFSGWAWR